jgi:hypothetical protein
MRDKNKGCITCDKEGKFKIASFGLQKDGKKIMCSRHKTENMINLKSINSGCVSCKKEGKFKIASFGLKEDNKKVACITHKSDDMIDLINKNKGCITCNKEGKFRRAFFGLQKDGIKVMCSRHKLDSMIDLSTKDECITCKKEGKDKRASFGFEKDGKLLMCSPHKIKGMVNLKDEKNTCSTCREEGIFKIASFGLIENNKKIKCFKHKSDDMINLVNKNNGCITCKEEGKFKVATYGFEKDGQKVACSTHKLDDMIDLVNKNNGCITCKEEGKFKRASFGLLFEKKIHCSTHKTPNEFYKNNPTCTDCSERPFYGDEKTDEIPKRCEEHKKPTDYDMVQRKCTLCEDLYFIPSSLDKCRRCLGFELEKKVKIKEKKVLNLLTTLIPKTGSFTTDSQIFSGCSKRRPDFYYPKFNDSFELIVECDEFQHSKYSCSIQGELLRIIDIYEQGTGGFPLLFVRFNPDPYYYKDDLIKIYKNREEILKKTILGLKNRTEFDMKIGVIYLFYDNFSEDNIMVRPLDYEVDKGILKVIHNHPLSKQTNHEIIL